VQDALEALTEKDIDSLLKVLVGSQVFTPQKTLIQMGLINTYEASKPDMSPLGKEVADSLLTADKVLAKEVEVIAETKETFYGSFGFGRAGLQLLYDAAGWVSAIRMEYEQRSILRRFVNAGLVQSATDRRYNDWFAITPDGCELLDEPMIINITEPPPEPEPSVHEEKKAKDPARLWLDNAHTVKYQLSTYFVSPYWLERAKEYYPEIVEQIETHLLACRELLVEAKPIPYTPPAETDDDEGSAYDAFDEEYDGDEDDDEIEYDELDDELSGEAEDGDAA
jgi:hypothetical protein